MTFYPKHQYGKTSWVLLPWLLFFTLAGIFWWFATTHQATPQAVAPTENKAQIAETKPQTLQDLPTPQASTMPVVSYHDAVEKAAVSVVNIYTTQKIAQNADPQLRQFLEYHGYEIPENGESSLGSGVVVSADGYVITNAHVIDKADEIVVALNDGRKAKAAVVGADKDSDLAVIKVELDNLTPIKFREMAVQVGDVTLAIGNPFGVGQTVTQGIVSATGRSGLGSSLYEDFVQTDAAINPGNSGGALVDAYGELVGINTMIYSRSGGSMGIGFAIPNAIVQKVMKDLIATGKVSRGWLGIEIGREVNDPTSLDSSKGVTVASVMPNAPASNAGLQAGDIITAVNGQKMTSGNELISYIARQEPNSTLKVEVERDGTEASFDVVLGERPKMQ